MRDFLIWLTRAEDRPIGVLWGIVLFYALTGLILAYRNRRR